MDVQHLIDLAIQFSQFAIFPLVGVLFQVQGRLARIEGKLEVMLGHDDKK